MRWFKHLTDARRDEKLTRLFDLHGHRGVLIWWWILEIIAEQMDETDRCHASHTETHWAKMLGTYRQHLGKILASCRDLGLIFPASSGDVLTISCPKLLEIRARKKPIGGKSCHLDIDTEVDIEKEVETKTTVALTSEPVSHSKNTRKNRSADADPRVIQIRDSWRDSYKGKYEIEPNWIGREAKAAKGLLSFLDRNANGKDAITVFSELARNYLDAQDPWLKVNRHPFSAMCANPQRYLETRTYRGPIRFSERPK